MPPTPPASRETDPYLDFLFQQRYRSVGAACPACRSTTARFYRLRERKAFICQMCGHKIHPCANTFLHKSSTSLVKWVEAMRLVSFTRGRITIRELAARLDVTHKCAWRIRDRLKRAVDGRYPTLDGAQDDTAPVELLRAFVLAAQGQAAPQAAD